MRVCVCVCVCVWGLFQCCFTSTETIRLIRDGEPRTATSISTQLLSSVFSLRGRVPLNPFAASACKISGLKAAHVHLQTVFSGGIADLLSML